MGGLLSLAFAAGMVAPVNPCGFALLPAWISQTLGDADASPVPVRLLRALRSGIALAIGFAGTLAAAGLLVSAGARGLIQAAPKLGLAVGVLLVLLGLWMLAERIAAHSPRTFPQMQLEAAEFEEHLATHGTRATHEDRIVVIGRIADDRASRDAVEEAPQVLASVVELGGRDRLRRPARRRSAAARCRASPRCWRSAKASCSTTWMRRTACGSPSPATGASTSATTVPSRA